MHNRTKPFRTMLGIILAAGSSLMAQAPVGKQTESAATKEIREEFYAVMNNLRASADKMPESAYDFKPAPGMRGFGELVRHVAAVQSGICRAMLRDAKPVTAMPGNSKAAVQKTLTASFDECYEAVSELSAENENHPVATPAGQRARVAAIAMVLAHDNEEYGYMSVYLRLKGIVPPSTSGDAPKEYKGK